MIQCLFILKCLDWDNMAWKRLWCFYFILSILSHTSTTKVFVTFSKYFFYFPFLATSLNYFVCESCQINHGLRFFTKSEISCKKIMAHFKFSTGISSLAGFPLSSWPTVCGQISPFNQMSHFLPINICLFILCIFFMSLSLFLVVSFPLELDLMLFVSET